MAAKQREDDLFCGVNRPSESDPEKMTDLEKKHVPVISAPESVEAGECFCVEVEVGKHLDHPNEPGHFIRWLELWAGETYLGRADLTHTTTCPVVRFCVSLDHGHGNLRALEMCNLHGLWEGCAALEVKA